MPQEMNVLCCYSCKMFQVHIVKKAKKWQCKVCNEKQSLQRVYFKGSGKDCRIHVQNLNSTKQKECQIKTSFIKDDSDDSQDDYTEQSKLDVAPSKWTKYLDSSEGMIECNTLKASDNEDDTCEDNDDDRINNVTNDNTSYVYSENDSVENTSISENILGENLGCDNVKEDGNIGVKEKVHNTCVDHCNTENRDNIYDKDIIESRKRKRIFEDSEIEDDNIWAEEEHHNNTYVDDFNSHSKNDSCDKGVTESSKRNRIFEDAEDDEDFDISLDF